MSDLTKDLEKDEDFVLKSLAAHKDISLLADNLTGYFKKYKKLDGLKIEFDETNRDWKIKCKKGEKRVEYPESIAKAIMELRE